MFRVDRSRRTVFAIWLLSMQVVLSAPSVLAINVESSSPRVPAGPEYHSVDEVVDGLLNEFLRVGIRKYLDGSPPSIGDAGKKRNDASVPTGRNSSDVAEGNALEARPSRSKLQVPLCCSRESRPTSNGCVETNATVPFPLYDSKTFKLLDETPDLETFCFFARDPCEHRERYKLSPKLDPEDAFMLLGNGSIYKQNENAILEQTEYCFDIVDSNEYDVFLYFDSVEMSENEENEENSLELIARPVGLFVSTPFLFATLLVYTLIPELKNMHGRTLRGYVGSLLVAYVILAIVQITPQSHISDPVCVAFAFIIHFSFLASFFWLNVMCFDIWWTFGGFRSLQGSVRQRERKKFLIYSIYAWGCASLLTGVCIVMDFLPNIPDYFIQPRFGKESCWFETDKAKAVYFYGPMGATVFCNICLFVSTALKILQHKKDTAHHLKGVDSRRHDDNKQWFNLYLKLFIVMGINWSMEIMSWMCNNSPAFIWYLTDLTNTLQGVIIFLIFVWKDKIKRLLLKRLGCRGRNFLSRNSTRSAYHSSASRTCTSTAAPLQEKSNPYVTEHPRGNRPTPDNNDSA